MTAFFQIESVTQPTDAAPTGWFARIRRFCDSRQDREHEIAFNRLAMCVIGLGVIWSARFFGFLEWTRHAFWLDAYLIAYSFGLGLHLWKWPGVCPGRRILGIVLDLVAICVPMYFGGAAVACMYPLLLWSIFGNGFCFGVTYLFISTVIANILFALLILKSEFWSAQLSLSIGLLLGLIVLPLYTSILIRQLSDAKRLAEESNKAKTLFLASISHELRTPLNAIIGLSDLLTETPLDEEQIDMSRVIGRSGRSLLSLINSILDVSRMQAVRAPPRVETVDLFSFLRNIHAMLAVQARAKHLRLNLYIDEATPQFLDFNPQYVEEILVNLAGNAIKFTETGYVTIRVKPAQIDGEICKLRIDVIDTGIGIAAEARVRIFERFTQADDSIMDSFGGTGLGLAIAKQLVEGMGGCIAVESVLGAGSVFSAEIPFARTDRPVAKSFLGRVYLISGDSGLHDLIADTGAIVSRFDHLSEFGRLLESALAPGKGRPVVLLDVRNLPVAEAEGVIRATYARIAGADLLLVALFNADGSEVSQEIESMLQTGLHAPPDRSSIIRLLTIVAVGGEGPEQVARVDSDLPKISLEILVAEDNRTNQMVIGKILERGGHRATIVADGEQALEALNAKHFDLAFIDLNMPVLNGIDAARLYQFSAPSESRTPLVALTADATDEARWRCQEAGMIACITKPVDATQLLAWLTAFAHSKYSSVDDAEITRVTATEAPAETTPIDAVALDDLKSLGGDTFVSEIVDQFLADAAGVLRNLHEAVAEGDVQRFRDEAHALRSCAANVGAQKVYKLCLDVRAIDARELAIEGELRIRRLETEFERAREALVCFKKSSGAC